jgi:hypothetical protein
VGPTPTGATISLLFYFLNKNIMEFLVILFVVIMLFSITYLLFPILFKNWFVKEPEYDIQDEMTFLNEAKWVEKVINSCEYRCQIWACDKLIVALSNKYKNKVDSKLIRKVKNNLDDIWLKQEQYLLYHEPKNK